MCTKICSICKSEKSIVEFYSQKSHKDGLMSMCKSCFNQLCVDRWKEKKKHYIKLLGGQCECCHIKLNNTNYAIFDFHHVDPNAKNYSWDKLKLFSDSKIRVELLKCQLLCANCHRLIHSSF